MRNRLFPLALLFAINFLACKKNNSIEAPTPDDNAAEVYAYILKLGFPASEIVDKPENLWWKATSHFPKT